MNQSVIQSPFYKYRYYVDVLAIEPNCGRDSKDFDVFCQKREEKKWQEYERGI